MQVEEHHRIWVQQSSVKRNRANVRKQKLLGMKEGEFIIQHIDNKSQFRKKKKLIEIYNLLLSKKG